MRDILTSDEYNVLNKIASQTKMDCWFWLGTNECGKDIVIDIEEHAVLTLRHGIMQLNEGVVPDLLDLTDEDIAVYVNLLKELEIEENPFAEREMKTYKITYTETLVHWFYVDAENAKEAANKFHMQVNCGEIDFSDGCLTDSSVYVKEVK